MPQYIIAYFGGDKPNSPEEANQHKSRYRAWLASLGSKAVSPANPLKDTNTINSDGSITKRSASSMSGFTIIKADAIEEALSIAKKCPFLDIGGSLEVSELMQMSS